MKPPLRVDVRPGDRLLVPGDTHFPVQDTVAVELMCRAVEDVGVTLVHLIGDTLDTHGLSKHPKDPLRVVRDGALLEEAEAARPTLTWLASLARDGGARAECGNHEDRTYDLIEEFPALLGMEWWDWYGGLFDDWECVPRGAPTKYGSLLVWHGDRLNGIKSGGGKYPGAKCLSEYPGQNTLFGHTHRIDSCTRPTWKDGRQVSHGAWTIGHLSDPDAPGMDYAGNHHWEQGFAMVDFFELDEDMVGIPGTLGFTVNQARILRDRRDRPVLHFGGKVYR